MASPQRLRLGICGVGIVGGQVVARIESAGIQGCELVAYSALHQRDKYSYRYHSEPLGLARSPDVDVVVELIGGTDTALEVAEAALGSGKHLVTANKAMLAEHGSRLAELAQQQGVRIGFEAAIGGGIPVVKTLCEGLAANRVERITGILNGTSNYILTRLNQSSDMDFAAALAEAMEKGYAEADASLDVGGGDAAQKLAILAALAFDMSLPVASVICEGIEDLEPEDFSYARELGYTIRPLAVACRVGDAVDIRVHPALMPQESFLARVAGQMNAVRFSADMVGEVLCYGPGAGGPETASAVLSDLLDIANGRGVGLNLGGKSLACISAEQRQCIYYLRIQAPNRPGMVAELGQLLAAKYISIEAIIQHEQTDQEHESVPLVLITSRVSENTLLEAVRQIEGLPGVQQSARWLRVED